ncbi:MAG: hypothetical protein HQ523_04865 [Lentisphaerae bacterium]|nr:hypothetical protein [Lentisphaerota bacterium]
MNRQLAIDTVNLLPTVRPAHTEYSLGYHSDYIRALTGQEPGTPEASEALDQHWCIDFCWSVNDGLHSQWASRGRTTEMGHATYAADGSDQTAPAVCPFTEPEEVWAFDPVAEYGLPDMEEQVADYQKQVDTHRETRPDQLVTGGYYRSIVSGAIAAFGWDMLLVAASEPDKFETVLDGFFNFTKFHMDAWASTDVEVIIQHDDFVWSEGPFMHPEFYRNVIIPRYAALWKPLKEAGKKVLFCSDARFDMFMGDVAEAGADGFIFEPVNDFGWVVENFGQTHCLVGSAVDCRDMTFGSWDQVKATMDRTMELAARCKGLVWACGNHLPANIPQPMMTRYIDYLRNAWLAET